MRRGPKTLLAALVALLVACGLAACGGDDGGTASVAQTAGSAERTGPSEGREAGAETTAPKPKPKPDADTARRESFQPPPHEDSGGGAEQFRVKGGDNSVQEFGDEAGDSERAAAAKALHDFLDARAAGLWAIACDSMAKSVQASLEELVARSNAPQGRGCRVILAKLTNPAATKSLREEAEAADVGSLRVEGGRAFIIFRGPEGAILTMPMAKEDGDWKVAALASTPLN